MKKLINAIFDYFGLGALFRNTLNWLGYLCKPALIMKNWKFRSGEGADGLPLQTAGMVYLVSGQFDIQEFYYNGQKGATWIQQLLVANSVPLKGRMLDFGCGCGRVLRFWKDVAEIELYGTDCNPRLIKWCRSNLDFVNSTTNKSDSPTDYPDLYFDIIYAISVFTHLNEDMQGRWLKELIRITASGGHIIITVHGSSRTDVLNPRQLEQYAKGELVVRGEPYSGSNICGVYHPRNYLSKLSDGMLEEVDYIECGATDAAQDIYLFRRLPASQ